MGFRKGSLEDLAINPAFWKNKRVLLTGHTGFKGSWLALWLQRLGAKLYGYSLPAPTTPNLFELAAVDKGMVSLEGDLCDGARLKQVVVDHHPEIVLHLAAQSLVRRSYEDPIGTYATNVMGTVNLLEAVRQAGGVKVVVIVTSDKCYKNQERASGYREDEPLEGYDPYSSSKSCAELVTSAFRNSFFHVDEYRRHGVALASARAGNVIGGGDWADDRLVPDIIRAMLENRTVVIRYPRAVRPWQHVLEPLSGYLLLAQKLWEDGPRYAEGWNFGPRDEDAKPVSWIADQLTKMWSGNAKWELDGSPQPHEAGYLKLDCSKAGNILGWTPRTDLKLALEWTVDWYGAHKKKKEMRDVTEAQIARFDSIKTT